MTLVINTWNTGSRGKGLKRPMKSTLFGGNIGHASLELTWPANEAGDELAQKYQNIAGVLISKRTTLIPRKTKGDKPLLNEAGEKKNEYQVEQNVEYFAYFSWWPGIPGQGHSNNNYREDTHAEWRHQDDRSAITDLEFIQSHYEGKPPMTDVKGVFKKTRLIAKVEVISHPTLKSDIKNDLAYTEFMRELDIKREEKNFLHQKGLTWLAEEEAAKKEKRPPNHALSFSAQEEARMESVLEEIKFLQAQIKACEMDYKERYSLHGIEPDRVIRLPTDLDSGFALALGIEKMLDKMRELSNENDKYALFAANCSTIGKKILVAGLPETLQNVMSNHHIDTPTTLARDASKLQQKLFSEYIKILSELDPDELSEGPRI